MTGMNVDGQKARLDTTQPHPARMYDYFLGGKDNFEIDRSFAEKALESWGSVRVAARENRAFLGRAVRYLVREAGIRQFLDIGTGLPSGDNVHQIAQGIAPACQVVYVDNDPIVLLHAQALLTSSPEGRTTYVQADLRDPESLLRHPSVRDVLDFDQPIALMLVAILHFISDEEEPRRILRTLLDALPSGSYLTASHLSPEHDPDRVHGAVQAYRRGGINAQARDSAAFAGLVFDGLELVDPGVTLISEWRPDVPAAQRPAPHLVNGYGAVARKP